MDTDKSIVLGTFLEESSTVLDALNHILRNRTYDCTETHGNMLQYSAEYKVCWYCREGLLLN